MPNAEYVKADGWLSRNPQQVKQAAQQQQATAPTGIPDTTDDESGPRGSPVILRRARSASPRITRPTANGAPATRTRIANAAD